MASNLTTTTKPAGPALPTPQSPAQRRTLAALTSGATTESGRMVLLPGKEITPDERRGMEVRLSTLRRFLDERDRRATEAIIGAFLASYGSSRGNEHEARLVIGSYASVLAEIPPWAVAETARAWTRGGYGAVASAFAPSAAQFHEAALRVVSNYQREAADLTAVLGATTQDVPADERDRVAAGMDRLRADIASRNGAKPASTTLSAEMRFRALCEEMGVDPASVPNAPAPMRKLGA